MPAPSFDDSSLDRMVRAVDRVRDRLARATNALNAERLQYAIVGSSAVLAWIASVDESATRFTNDIDILAHRSDQMRLKSALSTAGFDAQASGHHLIFVEGSQPSSRHALRVVFAGEYLRESDLAITPSLIEFVNFGAARVLSLQPLVEMLLIDHRVNARVDVRDMIDVGLIDATWPARFQAELGTRLQALLDDPDG